MTKPLSEMSLELWQLFLINLVPHSPLWKEQYAREAKRIQSFLPDSTIAAISHIGSTAIESIWAKPIVDILLEVSDDVSKDEIGAVLVKNGYTQMSAEKMSFNKGYTPTGFAEEVFHLHLRSKGDDDEVYFRDYLNAHPDIAKEYEALKLALWKRHEHDRDKYTDEKSDFVQRIVEKAKKEAQT